MADQRADNSNWSALAASPAHSVQAPPTPPKRRPNKVGGVATVDDFATSRSHTTSLSRPVEAGIDREIEAKSVSAANTARSMA